jgi:hypothetical protein
MAKDDESYWPGRLTLHWMSRIGIEEEAALMQLHRAICEGKLRAIGQKCKWRNGVGVPYGDMEPISPQEASDLSLILGPRNVLHLYPLYDDDHIMYFHDHSNHIINKKSQTYFSWCNLFFNGSDIRRLWPGNGKEGAIGSTINPKRGRIAPQIAATRHNKIETVHAVAQRRFGEQRTRLANAVMAAELAKPEHNLGYAEGTIRQILNGTYGPAKKLGIGPFEPKKPSRPSRR